MRVHQILISTNYLEVTHFSHEKFSIFPITAVYIVFCFAYARMRARIDRVSVTCVKYMRDPRSVKDVAWMHSPRFTVYLIINSSKQPPSNIPQAQPRRIEICEQRLFWGGVKICYTVIFIDRINIEWEKNISFMGSCPCVILYCVSSDCIRLSNDAI